MNEPIWNDREQLSVSSRHELPTNEMVSAEPPKSNAFTWGLLAVLGVMLAMFYLGSWATQHASTPAPITVVPSVTSTQNTPVLVHVAGAVKKPGVYSLPSQARISQAIAKAGGALPSADVDQLNLADWAKDGTRIEVPEKPKLVAVPTPTPIVVYVEKPAPDYTDESSTQVAEEGAPEPTRSTIAEERSPKLPEKPKASKAKTTKKKKPDTIAGMPRALTAAGKPSDNASPEFLKKNPLNLNRATAEQLEALPGVGPSLAQKVLDFRKQNGGFKSVEELDQVPGIGPKKLEEITPLVTIE